MATWKDLQGDPTLKLCLRFPHLTHAALTERFKDFVMS